MRDEKADRTTGPGREISAFSFLKALMALREDPVVKIVRAASGESDTAVWLVGGVLRNLALGRPPAQDYDFVTAGGDISGFCESIAAGTGGSAFLLDRETLSYRIVANVVNKTFSLDFSPVKESILNDLSLRDFTVNSLAVDLKDIFESARPAVIDPSGGVKDAEALLLRVVSKEVFDADPLRVLRAVRLSQQYGLRINTETFALMKEKAALLESSSAERIRDELIAVFSCRGSSGALRLIYSAGMIGPVLPGAEGWADVDGYGLLEHSLKTLDAAESLLDGLGGTFPAYGGRLTEHFASKIGVIEMKTVFKLAAFLHDFGKPTSMTREGGRLRFTGHDSAGGALVKQALLGLKFSRKAAGEVAGLVKNHHRVFDLAKLTEPSHRAKAHLFRASGGASGVTLLCLAAADARATRGADDSGLLRLVDDMLGFYYTVYLKKKPAVIFTGNEVMKRFGIPEGPLVGEILKKISEGVEKGEIRNKKEAVVFAEGFLGGRKPG